MSQRLPRYMRRRASSHNPKRIPRSVRQSAVAKQANTKDKPKSKKKKYVNKNKRLISIKKRSERKDRSVLHIWFAKRFQMKRFYNRIIAVKNNTKNQRSLYHKSKTDFVLYYLSTEKCIEIDFSDWSHQEITRFMCLLTKPETSSLKTFDTDQDQEVNAVFNEQTNSEKPLAPVKLISNRTKSKLWIWSHISIYEQIITTLDEVSQKQCSNRLTIKSPNNNFERFRVIGPKSLHLLSKCFDFNFDDKLKPNETKNDSIHYMRCKENVISIIDSQQTSLFDQHISGNTSSKNISQDFDFVLIMRHKTFINRFAIDLIVSSDCANTLWYKIAENRSHKVGGLRDLQMMALNTSSLFFPDWGFIDHKHNQIKQQKLKHILNCENEDIPILRNRFSICKLSRNMSSDNLRQIMDSLGNKEMLINVELVCVDRGVPQDMDHICLPEENEIQSVIKLRQLCSEPNDSYFEANEGSHERQVIGLIEFGNFCLQTSRGKGLGVVSVAGLQGVIAANERVKERIESHNDYKNKTIASFKSLKSGLYRMVFIKVIDSVFSL